MPSRQTFQISKLKEKLREHNLVCDLSAYEVKEGDYEENLKDGEHACVAFAKTPRLL